MSILQRTLIDKTEVLKNGDIQVREATEFYDDTITPVDAVGIFGDEDFVEAVTDILSQPTYHRYVVSSADVTPLDVQAFLDNSKA